MRIAAIYDIHGNLPALEAVLADIYRETVDLIVVGGDVVAGPMPGETLALLQSIEIPTRFIHGNAESEVLRHQAGLEIGGLSPHAEGIARWVAERLTPDQLQFLKSWPTTTRHKIEGLGEVLFCHATPHNDIDVFTPQTSDETLMTILGNVPESIMICGHTHMQFDHTLHHLRIINAGSVGMPFGKTGADWLLLDTNVTFKHTDYDQEKAAERIRHTDYPQAEAFADNNVLQAPTEAQASEMLIQLAAKQAEKRKLNMSN